MLLIDQQVKKIYNMTKGGKIAVWTFVGLGVLTGIFFGTRAIIRASKLNPEEKDLYALLKKKQREGTLSAPEREMLDYLENKAEGKDEPIPPPNDPNDPYDGPSQNNPDVCSFPLGNGDGGINGCKKVAQIQTALNQKHNDMSDSYNGSYMGNTWWCNNKPDSALAVDGQMGEQTLLGIEKYYGNCCSCGGWGDTCLDCKIGKSRYQNIINGADTTDERLIADGFMSAPASNFSGNNKTKTMRYFNQRGGGQSRQEDTTPCCMPGTISTQGYPPCPSSGNFQESINPMTGQTTTYTPAGSPGCIGGYPTSPTQTNSSVGKDTNRSVIPAKKKIIKNRKGKFNNFSLPQYGPKYSSPLGNFYRQQYAFTDDYPKQSNLTHSYGMGKGFGFSGFSGKTGSETEIQTWQEFEEDVP